MLRTYVTLRPDQLVALQAESRRNCGAPISELIRCAIDAYLGLTKPMDLQPNAQHQLPGQTNFLDQKTSNQ